MATPPLASTGIGSGLDVNAIVDKLMAVERRPLQALEQQQAAFRAKISAYGVLKSALGEAAFTTYLKLKHDDWNAYASQLTTWERETTLDC